jgi:hypothetical protein
MNQEMLHTLRIVIQPTGNSMTLQHGGQIIDARSFEPGRLWEELAENGNTASLSFAYCQETCLVLKKSLLLRGR